ncbi:1130_t:CDS:2, partial [Acaulospora colombiana]
MPPKPKKPQKKKVTENVSSTVAGTSGTSGTTGTTAKGKNVEIFENAPPLRTELSSDFGGINLDSPSTLYKIWIKYGDGRPVRLTFGGEIVDDLIEAIKKKLSPKLNDVVVDDITLRRHGEKEDLDSGLAMDQSFENNSSTPLQVIVNVPVTSKRKHEEPPEDLRKIMESVAESAAESALLAEDFQPISPINCQPFVWNTETDEAHQMPEVKKWFKKALNLPRGFYVKDVHTQIQERHLKSSNITLRGGIEISIGASDNDCVWIETKKKKEDFKEGQAIGELFI